MNVSNYAKLGLAVVPRIFSPRISRINVVTTNRCNQRCQTCGIWSTQPKEDFPPQVLAQVLERNRVVWVALTGGEPSTHPQLPDLLVTTMLRTPLVHLNTNGLLTERIRDSIDAALSCTTSILAVNLSVFGRDQVHDQVTGVNGAHRSLHSTITALQALRAKWGSKLQLVISHTRGERNALELPYVARFARAHQMRMVVNTESQSSYYHNGEGVYRNGSRPSGCVAGEYTCWVAPDGNVYLCMWNVPGQPLFNLRDTDYSLDLRHFEEGRKHAKACAGCLTACETLPTLLWRPWRRLLK